MPLGHFQLPLTLTSTSLETVTMLTRTSKTMLKLRINILPTNFLIFSRLRFTYSEAMLISGPEPWDSGASKQISFAIFFFKFLYSDFSMKPVIFMVSLASPWYIETTGYVLRLICCRPLIDTWLLSIETICWYEGFLLSCSDKHMLMSHRKLYQVY